ncbi:MAG: NAD-dependent epimerase/dehydratase family protein, partial [SAR324 cluster bacterium]|nr:NAD-dependent epimerase/dehydratase family protein [SAR324 cluster bacterium]
MRCLVSGVAGFIGSSIAERLLKEGHSVVGLDCFLPYYAKDIKERNLKSLEGFSSFSFVESNLLECDLNVLCEGMEWIFHEAAQAGVRASWGAEFVTYTSNNILATQRLLEAVRGSSSLKKIIYASSSSVYGNAESYPTKETTLPRPISPYGVSKLAAEHLMRLYASEFGVPTASLRYFTVFGPRQRPDMAFNRFISAALKGNEIVVYGDGEQMRDFTFIDDVVDANLLAAERGQPGSVMNIGGGTNATVLEVLDIISSLIGPLKIKKIERQAGDAKRTSADTRLARQEIGFTPKVGLEE